MRNSVRPGLVATTAWPRTGVTSGSPASWRAWAPAQVTARRGPARGGRAARGARGAPGARPPRALGPGPKEAEMGGHGDKGRGVAPAAAEPRRQLGRAAGAPAAELAEPVRRGGR